MKHFFQFRHLTLEKDVQNGKAFEEHEHEFYVLFKDFEFLQNASSMDLQEQWGIKIEKTPQNDASGSLRIRKVQTGSVKGGPAQVSTKPKQYVLTTKCDLDVGIRNEVPIPTTEPAFDIFARFSESGMIKHRYHFPVNGLVFEVDVFINPEGGYCEWTKVDLEVKNKDHPIPPFPFTFEKMVRGDSTEPADRELISSLFKNYFITPNRFVTSSKSENEKEVIEEDPGDHEYR